MTLIHVSRFLILNLKTCTVVIHTIFRKSTNPRFCEQIKKKRADDTYTCLEVLDLEPKDMYHCHPYHFSEIYKPLVLRAHQVLSGTAC